MAGPALRPIARMYLYESQMWPLGPIWLEGLCIALWTLISLYGELFLRPMDARNIASPYQFPYYVMLYVAYQIGASKFCCHMESKEHAESPRFEEYPRWSSVTTMFLHHGVHQWGAMYLTARLVMLLSDEQVMLAHAKSENYVVTVVEVHVIAAAMAIMIRDFLFFKMDWMFWGHHMVVVAMCSSLYLFAPAPQWLICCFVCATMEAGSGGYDVFIMSDNPTGKAGQVYWFMITLSHLVTNCGVIAYACQNTIPQGPVFWVFLPVLFLLTYHRQVAVGHLIKAEAERRSKGTATKSE